MPDTSAIRVERQPAVILVRLQVTDLDEDNVATVRAELESAAKESSGLPFVIDMTPIKYVPSLTLGALVRIANDFRARGQKLSLACLQPAVRQVFTVTRLDRIMTIHDTLEWAIRSLTDLNEE